MSAPLKGLRRPSWFALLLWLALVLALAFLTLPVLAIFLNTAPGRLLDGLSDPQALEALRLSLETSAIAVGAIVLVGTPAAFLLARRAFPGRAAISTLVELPLVLPPVVAGIGLLEALGPHGILGGILGDLHVQLVLQTAGVVVALTFVASPFYLRLAQAAFAAVEQSHLDASRTLGRSQAATFLRVAVPLAGTSLVTGVVLAWARALGEFGATLMFAGSFQGVTQTAPLAIYDRFAVALPSVLALSAILVIVSASLLLAVKLLSTTPLLGLAAR
jgi:molybdate transport system permease protein